jgi:hypothetical protein
MAGFEHMIQNRDRWENNNKMDLKNVRCEGVNWFHVAQDRISGRLL